jgi:hypothetical protein
MKLTDSQIAAYPEYAQESTGAPRFPVYPVINDEPKAYSTPADGIAPLDLGQGLVDRYGFHYIYVRAQAAFAKGQWATLGANPTEAAVQAPDAVADNIHVIKTNFTGLTKGEESGNFLHVGNTTGSICDLKLILDNTTTAAGVTYITISQLQFFQGRGGYDGNAPAAAYAAAGSELSIVRPYQVAVGGNDGECFGIAMGAITSGRNTLLQTTGLASVLGVAATTFTDNALVYTQAAGEVSVTAAAIAGVGIVGLSKSAYAGANSVTVPVWLMNIESKW